MAVGICNCVDNIDIRKRFGNVETIELPYFVNEREQIDNEISIELEHNESCILIGHSGMSTDNHLQIIDSVSTYNRENCLFYFVLSYGYDNYIGKVKEYAYQKLGDKAIFVTQKMDYEEYLRFLHKMDVVIIDGKYSYALGNIGALLLMRKKFVINEHGVIRKAFDKEGLPYITSDKLGNICFDELIRSVDYNASNSNLVIHDYSDNCMQWKRVMDFINEKVKSYEGKW